MHQLLIIILISISMLFSQTSLNRELNDIKKQLEDQLIKSEQEDIAVNIDPASFEPVKLTAPIIDTDPTPYFGYDYFKREINFFDNTPTPSDYKLGPGDEIILSLWGEHNLQQTFLINKGGLIYYENIGFINLSNTTISEAEKLLKEKLSTIYATLTSNTNSTKLMIELGKIKSINVYFSGELSSPGIHLIHPFSDIFGAIVQSGGVNQEGSLRNIKIIRLGKTVATIDFYDFFTTGTNSYSSLKLIDGDIIHAPKVGNRIKILGEINRPGYYEILDNENLGNLIDYATGLKAKASSAILIDTIVPIENRLSDDYAISSMNINFSQSNKIALNDGDVVTINTIGSVDSKVEIFGRVKNPGKYSAINSSLKDILDIAGGFDDPIFRKTILDNQITILRQDKNQFYSKEILVDYKNADQFKLKVNDKIFIYEDVKYSNNYTYRIEGEVYKPGTYPMSSRGVTVEEALSIAGGLTELSSERNITVIQEFTELDEEGNISTTSESVNDVTLDFKVGINSVIRASPFENVVRVEGNVYSPGLITYKKGAKLPRYIELAGGYKPNSIRNRVYIKRANGNIEQTNSISLGWGKRLYAGDTIIVPVNPEPNDFDITAFISDLSTTLANIAAILLIVDNQN